MRFDARCSECKFFKLKNIPSHIECANNDGSVWDPNEKACDNFVNKRKAK
ncbi:MAG: hypothetical protein QW051_02430 [Candidatus Aenigmatarchaeota archaeon]